MTWPDLVVLAILLLSAVIGLMRGFVREALGVCAWIGAALLASGLYTQVLPLSRRLIGSDTVADPVAFLVVFSVLLIAFLLIAGALGGLMRNSVLGGLDRLAGCGFGVLRGFVVLVIAHLVVSTLLPEAEWPQSMRQGRGMTYIREGAAFVKPRLPSRFRPAPYVPLPGEDRAT